MSNQKDHGHVESSEVLIWIKNSHVFRNFISMTTPVDMNLNDKMKKKSKPGYSNPLT